ncbi:hypothetical protein, partial [Denitromonas iodatirespirans]
RYSASPDQDTAPFEHCTQDDIQVVSARERTNYPLTVSVDDLGDAFSISVLTLQALSPERVGVFMLEAITGLIEVLEGAEPDVLRSIQPLPAPERHQVLVSWNATDRPYPRDMGVHTLFEAQALAQPEAVA